MKSGETTKSCDEGGSRLYLRFPPAFWFILGICILLRIPNFAESLWFDELWSTKYRLANLQLLKEQILGTTHPPLHFISMYVWIRLFGDSAISVRLPFLLFGVGSVVLTYFLGSKLFGRSVALLASFFLAISPVHIWYSQESRPYTALAFFLLMSVYSLQELRLPSRRFLWHTVYFLSLTSLLLSHYFSCFFLIPFVVMCLLQPTPTKRISLILTLVAALIFVIAIRIQMTYGQFGSQAGHLRQFTVFEFWMLCFQWFGLGNSVLTIGPYDAAGLGFRLFLQRPEYLPFHLILLLFLLRGVWYAMRHGEKKGRRSLLACFLIAPVTLIVLKSLGWEKTYIERSLFSIFPLYALLLAQGVLSFQRIHLRRISIAASCVLSIAVLIGYYLSSDKWTVYKPNPDWAAAARYMVRNSPSQEGGSRVLCASPSDVLLYYEPEIHLSMKHASQAALLSWMAGGGKNGFFLIQNLYWSDGIRQLLERVNSMNQLRLVEKKSFKGIYLYKYAPDSAELSDQMILLEGRR